MEELNKLKKEVNEKNGLVSIELLVVRKDWR